MTIVCGFNDTTTISRLRLIRDLSATEIEVIFRFIGSQGSDNEAEGHCVSLSEGFE